MPDTKEGRERQARLAERRQIERIAREERERWNEPEPDPDLPEWAETAADEGVEVEVEFEEAEE
jgi:hypothetical protein